VGEARTSDPDAAPRRRRRRSRGGRGRNGSAPREAATATNDRPEARRDHDDDRASEREAPRSRDDRRDDRDEPQARNGGRSERDRPRNGSGGRSQQNAPQVLSNRRERQEPQDDRYDERDDRGDNRQHPSDDNYDGPPLPEAFRAIGLRGPGLRAVAELGFEEPTPIQEQSMPLLYEGRDVVGLAQTGTGKTLAFGDPLAASIDPDRNYVQALILVPTRELADQVNDVIDHLGRFYGFGTIRLVGGKPIQRDLEALERGAQVIVGTPGRTIDHLRRRTLSLSRTHFVVLDEADEMLDIGFAKDIDQILREVPLERQTALFSATMPMSISKLVWRYMRDSERIEAVPAQLQPVDTVRQLYCEVAGRDKFRALNYLHDSMDLGRSLIFRRTKIGVDRLTQDLQRKGIQARAIHGDLRQSERDHVMRDFRAGKLEWLIATNVAARGLDIPDIAHVVNYDVPQNAEEYIHRVGRTARAGKEGSAITFVSEWEFNEWEAIVERVSTDALEHLDLPTRFD